jgi:phosphoserine phosphatase
MPVKLVIFDVDGTILRIYSWQYIHEKLGTWQQARKYYSRFFKNEITYEEWARLDAALWKNQQLARIDQIINQMPYTEGAKETLSTLKRLGIKTYLLSAGLTQVAKKIQIKTDVDGYMANDLISEGGVLTGEVKVNVSFHNKDKHLPVILQKFHLKARECAAVGDDPTLIPLFKKVALAIAFNPTDVDVAKHAHVAVKSRDLRDVLTHLLEHH